MSGVSPPSFLDGRGQSRIVSYIEQSAPPARTPAYTGGSPHIHCCLKPSVPSKYWIVPSTSEVAITGTAELKLVSVISILQGAWTELYPQAAKCRLGLAKASAPR